MAMFLRPWTLEVVWHRQHVGRAVKHVLLDLNEIDTDPDVVNQRIHLFRERDVVTRAHRQELLERHRVVLAH